MKAMSVAVIIEMLIVVPLLFLLDRNNQIQEYSLIGAGVLAFVAIVFRWYKNLGFDDRFFLALQVLLIAVSILTVFDLNILFSPKAYPVLFYAILIIIGIYTTFFTRTGFIGIIDDPDVVRKNSLILLSGMTAMMLGVIFLEEWLALWVIVTLFLWRSLLYAQRKQGYNTEQ